MTHLLKELAKPLDSSRVKKFGKKAGAKAGLSFLEGHDVINELNMVFGFKWSSQVTGLQHVETRTYENDGKKMVQPYYICQCSVLAEINHPDGQLRKIQHDGVGGGSSSMPEFNVAEAHEFAAKNAETDALKRAAMKFGDRFGLALYEKEQTRVEAPFNHARARADLFAQVTKAHNLPKEQAIEHIQAAIKQFNDGKLVPFETFDAEQVAAIFDLAMTTPHKGFTND